MVDRDRRSGSSLDPGGSLHGEGVEMKLSLGQHVRQPGACGDDGTRTHDPLLAKHDPEVVPPAPE